MNFANSKEQINYSYPIVNTSLKGCTISFRQNFNRFFHPTLVSKGKLTLSHSIVTKLQNAIDSIIPIYIHQHLENQSKKFLEEYVGDYFHNSNQRTSSLISIELGDLGYVL